MEYLSAFWQFHWLLAILVLCFIAFLAGFVDSVAGGGGLFLVPGFLLVGLPPQYALGQEKIVSTLGTLAAIRNFVQESKMLWRVAALGVPFALGGAYVGAQTILLIPAEIVAKILLVLIPVGIILFALPKQDAGNRPAVKSSLFYCIVPLVCFLVGFYDGFFGPGTGSMFIIAFHYLLRLDLVSASANAKSFNFASNIGALVAFAWAGKVIYQIALPLVISNIVGNHVGSKLALANGANFVKKVLLFSMFVLFVSLLAKFVG